jgi:hypothetical protein
MHGRQRLQPDFWLSYISEYVCCRVFLISTQSSVQFVSCVMMCDISKHCHRPCARFTIKISDRLIDVHHQQPFADPIWDDLQDELW